MQPPSAALPDDETDRLDSALRSELGDEVSDTYEELTKKLRQEVPMVVGEAGDLRLRRPDRRLQWGITRRQGVFSMALLVENKNSWALTKAKELQVGHGAHVVVGVTGQAFSTRAAAIRAPRERPLRPGLSISHYGGWAGTLGCLVVADGKPGLLGASHVLSLNNRASTEGADYVIQPGIPDSPPLAPNRVGVLSSFVLLAHYSTNPDNPANTLDVGMSTISNPDWAPDKNWVPNPAEPDKRRISIKGVLPAAELFGHIGEKVYKIGRTTGYTEGVLEFTNVKRYPIKLPDGKAYVYDDIACVATNSRPFSDKGDSGAMVYLKNGLAIGLIIGGSSAYTFISPLSLCLEAMGAKLLGV